MRVLVLVTIRKVLATGQIHYWYSSSKRKPNKLGRNPKSYWSLLKWDGHTNGCWDGVEGCEEGIAICICQSKHQVGWNGVPCTTTCSTGQIQVSIYSKGFCKIQMLYRTKPVARCFIWRTCIWLFWAQFNCITLQWLLLGFLNKSPCSIKHGITCRGQCRSKKFLLGLFLLQWLGIYLAMASMNGTKQQVWLWFVFWER